MKTFAELDLIAPVQRALAEENYETPTPIQAQTIPPALEGRDVLGCAQTGTGKTAAFALPILNRLGQHNRKAIPNRPFVLVLAPTRELAIQIGESFATYGRHLHLRQALVYGGVSQMNQVAALKRGAHILVATPGRLLDLMNQGHIHLDQLEVFVLDEADRMLDMGFLPDLKRIISKLPQERQSLFFSATMPPKIVGTVAAIAAESGQRQRHAEIDQRRANRATQVVRRTRRQAVDAATDSVTCGEVDRALVFTKTKRGANMLAEKLLESRRPGDRHSRQQIAGCPTAGSGSVPTQAGAGAGRDRRGRPRDRHRRHHARRQLRPAAGTGELRPPHRPHGSCRCRRASPCRSARRANAANCGRSNN